MTLRNVIPIMLCGYVWSQSVVPPRASGIAESTESSGSSHLVLDRSAPSPGPVAGNNYTIGAGDVLAVNVWKEPDISRAVPVRSDGKISLPLAGELQASGMTPKKLEQEIAARLQSYITDPEVTVIVQEIKSQKFNILGQVAKPGTYLLTDSTTVVDAIAMAGGFRDFAKQKSIYVLRAKSDGTQEKLPFNYKEVIKGAGQGQNVKLEPHDTVVVP